MPRRGSPSNRLILAWILLNLWLSMPCQIAAQSLLSTRPRNRIGFIDDESRVTLSGNRHPMARRQFEVGPAAPNHRMQRMILALQPDARQQSALDQLLVAQHNPQSPYYHRWLTPQSFGKRFGVSENDLAQIRGWLQLHGMSIDEVSPGRRAVVFSGTVMQVESAFRTQIHTYRVAGKLHRANASDPQIPQALAKVVAGPVSLHDFRRQPLHQQIQKVSPAVSYSSTHYMAPADFATIYDLGPLYQQGITGSAQSVAIVGRTNIKIADVRKFRNAFGLPPNDPQIILNGRDPGVVSFDEETEADLDVQWSGAVARNAAIKFVVSASTGSSDGVDLSALYIVNHNLAPVMSTSFGLCEAQLGKTGTSFYAALWQQAAAQGITTLISSGDSGAAGCDLASSSKGVSGRAVNGLCSTPYSTCVGGTEFDDASNPLLYWSPTNDPATQASAISYIPEKVWNESGSLGSGLWASGGGVSTIYAKPSWQKGPGVPADGKRDVPDVSLSAASHDAYLVFIEGSLYLVSGTSASSPSFAGLMALVVQKTASRQGNANPVLYTLANRQATTGGAVVFHDTTVGSNSVPGVKGFNAGAGYDLATGLGSVDAATLVNHWADAALNPTFVFTPTSKSVAATAGSNVPLNVSVSVSGGFNAPVLLSTGSLPSGVSAAFSPVRLVAPGAGSSLLTLSPLSAAKSGDYPITLVATGGGITKTASVALTVNSAPSFTLTVPGSVSVAAGKSANITVTARALAGFNSTVTLSTTGLPAKVTASFNPSSIAAPGSGSSVLTLKTAAGVAIKSSRVTIAASGGGLTRSSTLTLNVTAK